MSEWKEFTGSEDQIHEMIAADEWIVKYIHSTAPECTKISEINMGVPFYHEIEGYVVKEYLICNPHPLEDMICQQARTGQPVYVLEPTILSNPAPVIDFSVHQTHSNKGKLAIRKDGCWLSYATEKPNWYIPGAKYRLTPFEE